MIRIVSIGEANYHLVARIYQEGLDTGLASFETNAPTWKEWDASHIQHSRVAAMEDEVLLGWAALSPTSSRCVYGGVGEVSIYIAASSRGKGVGCLLLEALIKSSEVNGLWSLQAGIFAENSASIALHIKCGFREIGYRERIAQRNGIWYDNLLFERRSSVVG